MFGYTAQQTLDAVQEMYEQKLVTYPRTDSQYLTDEMGESTETLIQMLFGKMPYAEGLEYHIVETARVPGNSVVFMLNDGSYFPDEQKEQLNRMMSENIAFVYGTDNKRTLISRVLGKTVDRNKISIEEKIGVAHIPMDGLPPYILTRIRLAQQFARIVITDQ